MMHVISTSLAKSRVSAFTSALRSNRYREGGSIRFASCRGMVFEVCGEEKSLTGRVRASMHSGGVCRMFSDVFLTHYNLFPYFFILVGIHICASPTLSVVYISSLLLFFVLCRASDAFPTNFGSRHVVRSSLVCFGFGTRRSACATHLDDILSGVACQRIRS